MILSCPACDTKYVIKDNAIPLGGRQVRCAACKHSWHQDSETASAEPEAVEPGEFAGPPVAQPEAFEPPMAEVPPEAAHGGEIAGEPQAEVLQADESPWGAVSSEPAESDMAPAAFAGPDEVAMEEAPAVADDWREAPVVDEPVPAPEEEFVGYAPIAGEGETKRRWPILLLIVFGIAVAAAAFWFLAPPKWKERAGIAQAGATPLQLMITTSDRQQLESGNELVAISGRVINPTDKEQNIPPIRAELRDKQSRKLVHSWTIAPPARVLAPRSSTSFNSAEVDVPKGGDELTVTLGS
jgi:predicted Zn finger-like uncharacterized protein